jgi:predicted nucleic acid-binding protein
MAVTYDLYRKSYPRDKRLFVDTNVFIFVFFVAWYKENDYTQSYVDAYEYLRGKGYHFYSNYDVITEVINVIMNKAWRQARYDRLFVYEEFKLYRDSEEGQRILNLTLNKVQKDILTHIDIMDKTFSLQDIKDMVVNDGLDPTDKAIHAVCKKYAVTLFADDKDFRFTQLDILTRNRLILAEKR